MDNGEREEHTFILRLWRERPATAERPAVWRLALTDARSRQRRGFGDLKEVVAFLQETMEKGQEPCENSFLD